MAEQTNIPTRKTLVGPMVGAVFAALIMFLNTYIPMFEAKPINAVLAVSITSAATFVVQYFTAPSSNETTVVTEDGVKSGVKI